MRKLNQKKYDVREFPFILTFDPMDRVYVAKAVDLSGCHSDGATPQKAIENIYEAMEGWIETALKNQLPVPPPSRFVEKPKKFLLRLDPQNASKLSLIASAQNKSVNAVINEAIASL